MPAWLPLLSCAPQNSSTEAPDCIALCSSSSMEVLLPSPVNVQERRCQLAVANAAIVVVLFVAPAKYWNANAPMPLTSRTHTLNV